MLMSAWVVESVFRSARTDPSSCDRKGRTSFRGPTKTDPALSLVPRKTTQKCCIHGLVSIVRHLSLIICVRLSKARMKKCPSAHISIASPTKYYNGRNASLIWPYFLFPSRNVFHARNTSKIALFSFAITKSPSETLNQTERGGSQSP
jgi:hypothetical protein